MTMKFCCLKVVCLIVGENDEIFMIHSGGKEVKLTEEINIEVEPKPIYILLIVYIELKLTMCMKK